MKGFADLWHEDAAQDIPFLPEGFGKLARVKEYTNPLAFMKAFQGGFDAQR